MSDPIVSRAIASVIEAIRAHTWRIEVEDNETAEEWINAAMADIYDEAIGKIYRSVLYGFQVAELYWEPDDDEYDRPRLVFPNPDGIALKVDSIGNYDGFRQWGYRGQIEVPADESICWSYGVDAVDITGSGVLHKIYDDVVAVAELYDHLVGVAKHHHLPIVIGGIPTSGVGDATAHSEFLAQISASSSNDKPLWFFAGLTPEQTRGMDITAISPVQGAMSEIRGAIDDLQRRIVAGLLATQKLFYNSPEDGGSYSLTQTQMAEFDRVIKGMWRTFVPGLNTVIGRTLWRNFRVNDYRLNIEYVDEQSLAAARKLIELQSGNPEMQRLIDYEAVLRLTDTPIVPEDEQIAPEGTAGERAGQRAEKTQANAIGRDTDAADKASRINKMLTSLSNPIEAKVRKSPGRAVKLGLKLVEQTDELWKEKNGDLPETTRDYRAYAEGIVRIYQTKLTELEFWATVASEGGVKYDKAVQSGNITRNLAKNIGKMATLRWTDLQRAVE